MPKALITGIGGFVGPYLQSELEASGYTVFGLERKPLPQKNVFQADITDAANVEQLVIACKPDVIFHLAGFSSVAKSWEEQELVNSINVGGTLNLLEAAKSIETNPRVVIVSSSEAYGPPVSIPVTEDSPLRAVTPYGKSRVQQEEQGLASYENVVVSRSFNHTGPGQPPVFVVSSFIDQAIQVKRGKQDQILVGNTSAVRDFSDVRDVVRAYRLLAEKGHAGEAYNVCSGRGISIQAVLDRILELSGLSSSHIKTDPSRLRPSDVPEIRGSHKKISEHTGWQPTRDFFDDTITDSLKFAEEHLL